MDDLTDIAAGIPALAGWRGPVQRLGGLTNRVYRLGGHILRLPGAGTAAYIDRAAEAVAAAEAARVGVSPGVVHVDAATGVMVTVAVDGTTMTPEGFATRPGAPARAGLALARLHRSDARFVATFDLLPMIDGYLRLLAGKDVALPDGYQATVAALGDVSRALAAHPVPRVACHCDPLCENFLDTGQTMWIVDWEYSGMNDPMWDLGDLAVEGAFSPAQEAEMMAAYFGGPVPAFDQGRMVIYKAMCDLLWTLWGLIQLADGNPAEDFRAYADGRFARCRTLMATEGFADALAAVARGPA